MLSTFRNSAFAFLAFVTAAYGQEEIIGGNVFRPGGGVNPSMLLMSSNSLPTSGTNQQFGLSYGYWASGSTVLTATGRAVPIPIGGTLSGLTSVIPALLTTLTVTDVLNGADKTNTCNYSGSPANNLCQDTTHTDSVNAGDLYQIHYNPNGTWPTNSGQGQLSMLLASNDNHAAMLGGPQYTIGTNQLFYIGPSSGASQLSNQGLTEINVSMLVPFPITVTGLYYFPNATENSNHQHMATICKNGTGTCAATPASGIYCQAPVGTAGCCMDQVSGNHIGGGAGPSCTAATPISFTTGDTISVLISCNAGGTNDCVTSSGPAIGIPYIPGTPGKTIMSNQTNSNQNQFGSMVSVYSQTTQGNYQIIPYLGAKTLTFSDLMACTTVAPTGTQTRTFTPQVAAIPTLPANVSFNVVINAGSGACTGAMSTALTGGVGPDTTHTWAAVSTNFVDFAQTVANTPNAGQSKFSASAIIR